MNSLKTHNELVPISRQHYQKDQKDKSDINETSRLKEISSFIEENLNIIDKVNKFVNYHRKNKNLMIRLKMLASATYSIIIVKIK